MITVLGKVFLGSEALQIAESIKHQNYKVNTPEKFQKHKGSDSIIVKQLALMFNTDPSKIDYVYFSAKEGAEPHVDKLSLSKFEDETIIIPVILPKGESVLKVGDDSKVLELDKSYKFNHTCVHSLELEDTESGCVLIMAAKLK